MSARLDCPACGAEGEYSDADQARCLTPECRVTTFQTTTPPDAARAGATARGRPGR
jgi:hypothetical protein